MLKLFRNQNPYSIIILFILAMVLKLPVLWHLDLPNIETNQILWKVFLGFLQSIFGHSTHTYFFLTTINIVLQALYLNFIVNNFHFYNKQTYLPAYTYILITSLLPQWSNFSLELANNWLILAMLHLIFQTYSDKNTRKTLFNIGFIFGLLLLSNLPNAWLFFFVALSISILRSYKPAEWMVTLFGITTPLYLLISIAYLTDNFYIVSKVFDINFSAYFKVSKFELYALSILLFLTILGGFVLLKQLSKMLFQIRKMWLVNALFLVFSILTTIGIYHQGAEIWILSLIPCSMLISKVWMIAKPKWMAESLNVLLIGGVVYLNYFL